MPTSALAFASGAFAAPASRNPPFVLDMATSTASLGKLTMAWRKGRSIPAVGGIIRPGLVADLGGLA